MILDRFGPAPDDDGPWECERCAEPVRDGERFCATCDDIERDIERRKKLVEKDDSE